LDIIERLSTTDYDRLVAEGASKGIIVKNTQNGDLTYITFGYLSNPVFYDVNVRKAIAYGVDWNALGQMAYGQLHKAPSGMLASSSPYFIETGEYEYNFDDAKQILTDAGYKDGDIVLNWLAFDNSMYKNLTQGCNTI
jgi:ABC-type transport system substrate-binding protein